LVNFVLEVEKRLATSHRNKSVKRTEHFIFVRHLKFMSKNSKEVKICVQCLYEWKKKPKHYSGPHFSFTVHNGMSKHTKKK